MIDIRSKLPLLRRLSIPSIFISCNIILKPAGRYMKLTFIGLRDLPEVPMDSTLSFCLSVCNAVVAGLAPYLNPFHPTVALLYPLENQKIFRFSDVFRGYSSATLGWNGCFFCMILSFNAQKDRFLRKIRYAENMVNEAFLGPKSTLLNVSLNLLISFFSKFYLMKVIKKSVKLTYFQYLKKILIMPKIGEIEHFWFQNQHFWAFL